MSKKITLKDKKAQATKTGHYCVIKGEHVSRIFCDGKRLEGGKLCRKNKCPELR